MTFWQENCGFIKEVYDSRAAKMSEIMDKTEASIAEILADKIYTSQEFKKVKEVFAVSLISIHTMEETIKVYYIQTQMENQPYHEIQGIFLLSDPFGILGLYGLLFLTPFGLLSNSILAFNPLGYFYLVGVIPRLKWNEWHLVPWQVCNFLGNSDAMIYFRVKLQFPPKLKKLESWWLIAIFSNREG